MIKKQRLVGSFISLQIGLLMGMTFTAISMAKQGHIVPIGIITSGLMSAVISAVVGFFISMKTLGEGAAKLLKCDPVQHKFLYNVIEAIIGDMVFTPILGTFFITMNVGIHNPMYWKILLTSLVVDFLIAIPLNVIFCPLFKAIASKVLKVSSIN